MAFDAKALSKTSRQVSWLSPSFRRLLRQKMSNDLLPEGIVSDLQLRDSSRIARDSLLAAHFAGQNLHENIFQSTVALTGMQHGSPVNAVAKIQIL